MKQTVRIAGGINEFFGTLDENLKFFESALQVTTHLKDHDLEIEGEAGAGRARGPHRRRVQQAHPRTGSIPNSQEVKSLLRVAAEEPASDIAWRIFAHAHARARQERASRRRARISAATSRRSKPTTWCSPSGPGGTGKTYLAVAMAVSALLSKQVNRIILARPAVEAGERLGFLPGTLQEKVDPYMRPLYDALHDLLDADKLERFLEKGIIEVAPLAFMRGRTLNDSFVILDEAQNTTSEQMKMFLTRLGFNSKAVITGRRHADRSARPAAARAWWRRIEVVGKIEGIAFVYFDERDVVRHNLVQQIIKAYDEYGGGHAVRPGRSATAHAINKPREQ